MWEFFALNALIDRFNSDADYRIDWVDWSNPVKHRIRCSYCGRDDPSKTGCEGCGAYEVEESHSANIIIPALDSE